ncbi:MAG TPA: DoxX family protein [Candidatus Nitrosopelagicus sp.]|jgi:putative oxidoreductase|nr:DoxX family protein [Candidatus Nitrosopelagicus sp.]HJN19633.1 DoxX family protein [Candidatus Nitrosopelagicus sp.]|tara:strand:- start:2764 stop:3177 length:414 start_codon:yes stop_codon:yes gene_type:complete
MDAYLSQHKLHDVVNMGLRAAVGVVFIVHGSGKFNPGFLGFMEMLGLPPEMQIPIALAETVPGILLLIGVFTRLSASLLSIVMLGAIFYVKQAGSLTGERGFELDLILLAACLVVMIAGPGRISIAHVVKKLPRCLH